MLGELMGLDRCKKNYFLVPKACFLQGGYLISLQKSEYGTRPLIIEGIQTQESLLSMPTFANVASNSLLNHEKN
jgi:hypothetical protein